MAQITREEIDEATDFAIVYRGYKAKDRELIQKVIAQHAEYNTLMLVRNDKEDIVALCRWNILPTGKDAVVLDVIIRPDFRSVDLLKRLVTKSKFMYPELEYLIYERRDKNKPYKKVPIHRFFKRRV